MKLPDSFEPYHMRGKAGNLESLRQSLFSRSMYYRKEAQIKMYSWAIKCKAV